MDSLPIPPGICGCGCGQPTGVWDRNKTSCNAVLGKHKRFISGHNSRKEMPQYVECDMGYETPCWVWTGSCNLAGYGKIPMGTGKSQLAHRIIYEALIGPFPEGLMPDHLCRVRPCVNPYHIEPVTNAVNIRRSIRAKITMDDARFIRANRHISSKILATMFPLSPLYIDNIKRGKRWAEGKE